MVSEANPEMLAVARRIARENGVSVGDVLAKFSAGVKKSAFTRADFFWGDSDISPENVKTNLRPSRRVVSTKFGPVRVCYKVKYGE